MFAAPSGHNGAMSSSLVAVPHTFEAQGTSRADVLAKLEASALDYYRDVATEVTPFEAPTISKTGPREWSGRGRYTIVA